MISSSVLWSIRNDLPMPVTVGHLADEGIYSKTIEGLFRFECPDCHELTAVVNPKNNLAHCFRCLRNINNIDLMMALGYDFKGAVRVLKQWLKAYTKQALPSRSEEVAVSH